MLDWSARDPASGWFLDQAQETLHVMHGNLVGRLAFGAVRIDPGSFEMSIDCSQPAWTGQFGLFLANRKRHGSRTKPGYRYYRLLIAPFLSDSTERFFRMRFERVYLDPQHVVTMASVDVPYPVQNKLTLSLRVDSRKLTATAEGVKAGRKKAEPFASQLTIPQTSLGDWRGEFGVSVCGSAASFRDFRHDLGESAASPAEQFKSIHCFAGAPASEAAEKKTSAASTTREADLTFPAPDEFIHQVTFPANGPTWVKATGAASGDICIKGTSKSDTGAKADKVWYRVHAATIIPFGDPAPSDPNFIPGGVNWQHSPVSNVGCSGSGVCPSVGITVWAQFGVTFLAQTVIFQGRCNAADTDCTNATPPMCG
jgi:hypothetical protein